MHTSSALHPPGHAPRVLCLTMNPCVDLATSTPRVQATRKLRCGESLHDAGGGGINVARVINRLGGSCETLCPAGGPTGEWLMSRMAQEGMNNTAIAISNETRVSFTVHEKETGAEYRFVLPGPHLSEDEWLSVLAHLTRMPVFPDWLVASGSLPPGVPIDFYAQLARLCQKRGGRLVLDTSGPALAAALTEGVYLFKPNLRELGELVGQPLETPLQWQAAARRWVEEGKAQVVALTMGHMGALLVTHEGMWSAPALDIAVASAVGAGDSFVGGMVWGLQNNMPLPDAFAWGVAAGSAALLSITTGLSRLEDALGLHPRVHLTCVA